MKILITILGFVNGGYMLLDGIFVMFKGKYIGPENPGPWANLFYKLNIDVFKLGPVFILFGILWLIWALWLMDKPELGIYFWTYYKCLDALVPSCGNPFSIIILLVLIFAKQKIGL